MRAEPFVAIKPPFAVLKARNGLDRADVGAAGALGHELGAFPERGEVSGQHFRQQVILQLPVCELADQMDRGVGHADRAHQAEFALHEQILHRVFGNSGQRPIEAERAGAMAHGVELEIAEGDVLHFAIGGVIVDPVLVAAGAVTRVQQRRILVGDRCELIESPARERAQAIEMRFHGAKIPFSEINRQQIAKGAITCIKIEPSAIGRDRRGAAIGSLGPVLVAGKRVHGRPPCKLPIRAVSLSAAIIPSSLADGKKFAPQTCIIGHGSQYRAALECDASRSQSPAFRGPGAGQRSLVA